MTELALLFASFNRADDVSDASSLRDLLAWFTLEEVGRYDQRHSMKLVTYLRVSTETQAVDGLGLDVERKGIRAMGACEWAPRRVLDL